MDGKNIPTLLQNFHDSGKWPYSKANILDTYHVYISMTTGGNVKEVQK